MSETVRIYVNGEGVDAISGCSVLDAIERSMPADAAAVRRGDKMITDSRGLPAEPATAIYNGAIFRLIRSRPGGDERTSEP